MTTEPTESEIRETILRVFQKRGYPATDAEAIPDGRGWLVHLATGISVAVACREDRPQQDTPRWSDVLRELGQ